MMDNLPALTETFEQLLKLEKIEPHHLDGLSRKAKNDFIDLISDKLSTLKGTDRDAFIEKTCALYDNELLWEYNHARITQEAERYLQQYGNMPTKTRLAEICGLSRVTIRKHLKSYTGNATWAEQGDAMNMMTRNVMGKVLGAALKGNLRAANIFLQTAKAIRATGTGVKNENNYIQINSTVINQQVIQQLKPEQLKEIEKIIAGDKREDAK